MVWGICLDKGIDIPLYQQLSDAVIRLIGDGTLKADTKLPPIRQMAQVLGVNNTTVVSAYKDLEQKAAVYSVVGSGTYVAWPMRVGEPPVQALPVIDDEYINFAHTATEAALFPVAAFKRAFNAVMDRDGAAAFGYHDSQGYEALRESACLLLGGLGVGVCPDVHIISGAKQGLEMLASALLEPGDTVFVEGPASHEAVLSAGRAKVIEMPMAKDGPDFIGLEVLLKRHRPKLFYVVPAFFQPAGMCYSAESKRRLLEIASAYDAYIVEEDQLSDFYYDGIKRPPLQALDNGGRVIYIKNFSRILTPGVGIGFMACPSGMPEIRSADTPPPGYAQRAFDIFIRSGGFEAHAANMRRVYGRRYQKLVAAAHTYLAPIADFELPGGGLSLWVTPHHKTADYADKFLQRKVVVSPGQLFAAENGFRISFAAVPEERIAEGIGVIASVLRA